MCVYLCVLSIYLTGAISLFRISKFPVFFYNYVSFFFVWYKSEYIYYYYNIFKDPSLQYHSSYSLPQGGTPIFSHIRRLGPFFGFKILNFNIFLGFQKNDYFLGVLKFCGYFLGGHHKIWLV